jgi:SAM-dependent methyltransferase
LHSRAESIFVPWENDPHPDHQATYQIIYAAVTRMQLQPRIIQYPVWLWELRGQADIDKISQMRLYSVDIGQTINRKIKAIDAHQSQIADLIDDDPNGFRLSQEMIAHFHATTELFFESNQPQSITMDNDKKTLDASYFNDLYSQNPDPWNFEHSEYEHTKYARTLGMISEMRFENAFEIGCSNGKLSESLAVQCKRLLAVDSSSIAVANATHRLSGFENVRVEEMEIPWQFPDDTFDLILLSEVGYFFTENDLRAVCEKIISVLEPQGHLLLVHWTGRVDEFPLTGDRVHHLFSEYSGDDELSPLAHLKNATDAQYRMDLFMKRG